jgi:fatty acid desaturase
VSSATEAHPADRIRRIPDPREPIPAVALPTLALLLGGLGLWAGSTALAVTGTWPWPVSVPLNAIASFVLFTVSHDAAHNAVSSHATVTTWMGRISTILFAPHAGFRTWRFIHMQHHRFTNHDDGRDPDAYTHTGPRWQLPLRWLTVDLHYMRFYLPQLRSRPKAERRELYATWALVVAVAAALVATGNGLWFLVLYLLPVRLAVMFLAWSFDFLPHHGLEDHTAQTNRFRATRNRVGAERVLSPLLLNQNYHLVHHLHPVIPFYRYLQVWRRGEGEYLANDPALSDVRGRPLTAEEYRRLRAMADHH